MPLGVSDGVQALIKVETAPDEGFGSDAARIGRAAVVFDVLQVQGKLAHIGGLVLRVRRCLQHGFGRDDNVKHVGNGCEILFRCSCGRDLPKL